MRRRRLLRKDEKGWAALPVYKTASEEEKKKRHCDSLEGTVPNLSLLLCCLVSTPLLNELSGSKKGKLDVTKRTKDDEDKEIDKERLY